MFKTIKSKTILMQLVMMLTMLAIVYLLFITFFDSYYFNRKLKTIKNAYEYIESADIKSLKYSDNVLVRYRDQNIKFLIADENFESVFSDEKIKNTSDADDSTISIREQVKAKIDRYIVQRVKNYKPYLKVKDKNHRICGYGIIKQDNKNYYVYIYETKTKMQIGFSYSKIYLLIICAIAILTGIAVSVWMTGKISAPIRKMEKAARKAEENNFNVYIDEKQSFEELSSLASSINLMLGRIREQMNTMEEEIEQKNIVEENRRQFIHNVSHELKTPLAIISSQVEMLALISDEDKKQAYCQSIVEETRSMAEMINEMLVVYSSQSDDDAMTMEETDLAQLTEEICQKYENLFNTNNLALHMEIQDKCIVKVNRRYISQAIDNYVTNSIKHSAQNDNITVRVMSDGNYGRIEVENEGPHIPEEYKEKIWDMFFKGDVAETLNGQKGSGLGLYLVKSIIELHKGNFGFENLEKGVVFWMEVPKV